MDGRKYPSDLTDEQWQLIEPLLPRPAVLVGRGGFADGGS